MCVSCVIESALTPDDPVNEWCPPRPVLNTPVQPLLTYAYGFSHGVSSSDIWSSYFPAAFILPSISVLWPMHLTFRNVLKEIKPHIYANTCTHSHVTFICIFFTDKLHWSICLLYNIMPPLPHWLSEEYLAVLPNFTSQLTPGSLLWCSHFTYFP